MPPPEKRLESRACEARSGAVSQQTLQSAEKPLFLSPAGDTAPVRYG